MTLAGAASPSTRAAMLAKSAWLGLIRLAFPPQCIACGGLVASDFGLCGACWRDTPFLTGPCCESCGVQVPDAVPDAVPVALTDALSDALPVAGPDTVPDAVPDTLPTAAGAEILRCEDCHASPPPWAAGRAVMQYGGTGRRLILALKHGDRLDLARPMGTWVARAAAPLVMADMVVAPVPLHRWRLFRRQYNQAALLSAEVARLSGLDHRPDLLIRHRATGSQEGRSREARFAALSGAIRVTPREAPRIRGRPVLLIDDVMTSGATLSAATAACHAAGAGPVCVLTLARVARIG